MTNWGGRLGALLADGGYYLLGWSVWWCFFAGPRAWLSVLAGRLRAQPVALKKNKSKAVAAEPERWWEQAWVRRSGFALALIVLLCASGVLGMEPPVPVGAPAAGRFGWRAGRLLGPVAMRWLGFTGSALAMLALLVVSTPRVFGFSWGQWAEHIGVRFDAWFESRREKREAVEDHRIGEQAAREREEVVKVERVEIEEQHPTPVFIEPTVLDVPKSERVAKERQKPLFTEMPDSQLPQVDLLDAAPVQPGRCGQPDAGDDQPPDREKAQGLWRGSARGGGRARVR